MNVVITHTPVKRSSVITATDDNLDASSTEPQREA
jgi:hypothetical protein